jgi:hypothetical protein
MSQIRVSQCILHYPFFILHPQPSGEGATWKARKAQGTQRLRTCNKAPDGNEALSDRQGAKGPTEAGTPALSF